MGPLIVNIYVYILNSEIIMVVLNFDKFNYMVLNLGIRWDLVHL
jgi:hypothetical protein